jgi:hypothetical protein
MEKRLIIPLTPSSEQIHYLKALQRNFVEICNSISPIVQASGCWNRVALHHMVYHKMRMQFPNLGSQMICNAIYSVSRAARIVLQHPKSPWNIENNPSLNLPRIIFLPQSPVFFDRHTLSLKGNRLSMYTTKGRIHFDLTLSEVERNTFHDAKLKEVLLVSQQEKFSLQFYFGNEVPDSRNLNKAIEVPKNIQVIPSESQQSILK